MEPSGEAAAENINEAGDHVPGRPVSHVGELCIRQDRRRRMDRGSTLENRYPGQLTAWEPRARGCSHFCSHRSPDIEKRLEAPPGFEPGMEVLQTSALP